MPRKKKNHPFRDGSDYTLACVAATASSSARSLNGTPQATASRQPNQTSDTVVNVPATFMPNTPPMQTSQATSPQQVIPQTGNPVNTTPSPDMRASIQPESLADAIPAEPASEPKQDGESPE